MTLWCILCGVLMLPAAETTIASDKTVPIQGIALEIGRAKRLLTLVLVPKRPVDGRIGLARKRYALKS